MTTSRSRAWLFSVIVSSSVFLTRAHGQDQTAIVSVNDPRPLEAAVLSLLQRYPVVITYEDARYEFSGDIEDVTNRNPGASRKVLIPRGGPLQANYLVRVSKETGQPDGFSDAVNSIVDAKNAMTLGARFDVHQRGGVFHIVPHETRDSNGSWIKQASILDTPISLSTGEMHGFQLIEAILKKVTETSGAPIGGVSGPAFTNRMARYSGAIEATNEPARDVLIRALHAISPRFTWIMNSDPGLRYYVFNLAMAAESPPKEAPPDLSGLPRPGAPTPAGPAIRQRPID